MFIRWHGFSCFEFSDGNTRVVTDPHDGKSIGLFTPNVNADVVLTTHNSFARNCSRVVKGTHRDFTEFAGECTVGGFSFTGFRSRSLHSSGGYGLDNTVYAFAMDGIRIAFSGSLGAVPDPCVIDALKDSDILFVPVGEYSTLPLGEVDDFIGMVAPKVVVPTDYKWGGITFPLNPIQDFMEGKDPEDFVHVGSEVEFMPEDIAGFTGFWIFDRGGLGRATARPRCGPSLSAWSHRR